MKRTARCLVSLAVVVSIAQSLAVAEEWPAWRGPRGDGTRLETRVPTQWSGSEKASAEGPEPATLTIQAQRP
jgi:hypothetical protein